MKRSVIVAIALLFSSLGAVANAQYYSIVYPIITLPEPVLEPQATVTTTPYILDHYGRAKYLYCSSYGGDATIDIELTGSSVRVTNGGSAPQYFGMQVGGTIIISNGSWNDTVTITDKYRDTYFDASNLGINIVFDGGYGDDLFDNQSNCDSTADGDAGNDILLGGGGYDNLFGDRGNDILEGGHDGIKDLLTGGLGADTFVAKYASQHATFYYFSVSSINGVNLPNNSMPVEYDIANDFFHGDGDIYETKIVE